MRLMQLYLDNKGRAKPVNVVKNGAEASIYIYDVIDPYWGVSAKGVAAELAQLSDAETLHVYINSPGGDIFESRAIMAELRRFGGKTIAHIDSLCASAATSIAIACNEIEMSDGAFFMIHNASCIVWGDKNTMRETADLLEKIEGSIVSDYTCKTGKEDQEIIDLMNAETWFSADEAKEHGFVDRVIKAEKAKNTWNLAAYEKAPKALTEEPKIEQPKEPEGIESGQRNANTLKLVMIV